MREAVRRMIIANRLLHSGDRVLVAVSGGADSVCLLHLLHELAPDFGIALMAAHFDHQLRPESGADAAFVRDLCDCAGIPLAFGTAKVAIEAKARRLGIEETARLLRRTFLRETAAANGCRTIALGHHRGDQAETVLHRLLRGSGASGLAGMQPQAGPFIRPLLEVSRQQILAWLVEERLSWVEDASNDDTVFTRNRLRHHLLPLLAEFNPRIEEHLARLGGRLGQEEDFWRRETERSLAGLLRSEEAGLSLDCRRLRALHPALRLRTLREGLRRVRGDLQSITATHLEDLDRLLHRPQPQGELHLPDAWAGRRYGRLLLRRTPPAEPAMFALSIPGPGSFSLPGGVLHVSLLPQALGEDQLAVEYDSAAITFPLRVRSFLPGDRFRPAGMAGRKKLKDFFIDAKLDREERQRVLLVEGEEILWVVGYRRSTGRQPGAGGVVRLRFQPAAGDNFDC